MATGSFMAWLLATSLLSTSVPNSPAKLPTDAVNPLRATLDIDVEGSHFAIALMVQGNQAALVIQPGGRPQRLRLIETPDMVLSLLQDRRFAPLWPALLEWAGADLSTLRDRTVTQAAEAFERGVPADFARDAAQVFSRPHLRALLQYVAALQDAGRDELGISLLKSALATGGRKSDQEQNDRSILTARLAGVLSGRGDLDQAVAVLKAGRLDLSGSQYAVNLSVNLAAYLAEGGRYAEALTTIDEAQREFETKRGHAADARVPGSIRQFAWIKACALNGLGRTAEARSAVAAITDDEPRSAGLFGSSSTAIMLRKFACERDDNGMVSELVPIAAGNPLSPLLLMLQPAYFSPTRDPGFLQSVRRDLRLQAIVLGWLRPLPANLTPALNHWRAPAPSPAP